MRRAWEKTVAAWEDTYNEEWAKYDDKAIAQRETEKLYAESRLAIPINNLEKEICWVYLIWGSKSPKSIKICLMCN